MSELCRFKEELRTAEARRYVYRVTNTYVKVSRWSLKGYFSTMSNWRIKRIGLRVKRMIAAEARREERRQLAFDAQQIKRNDVLGDAAEAIGLVRN